MNLPTQFIVISVKTDGSWNEYTFSVHDPRWKEVLYELRDLADCIKILYR